MASVLEHTRRKLDVETVFHLLETGRIGPEERVELVDGELLTMPASGSEHARTTAELVRQLSGATPREQVFVTDATPLRLDRYNEVRPDVLVLRQRREPSAESHPTPADALLVVEVADGTRGFDRGRKAELYARFAVGEYWVVDLVAGQVLVHRAPESGAYGEVTMHAAGALTPNNLPDAALDVAALLS